MKTWLTETFSLKYPIIMAPMFLVSNEKMLIAASESGIMGCIPALNYKTPELFEAGLKNLKENCKGAFGINLIVNKSNIHLSKQIALCEKYLPDFIITSLGSPETVIKILGSKGVKVLCDVVDVKNAKKCEVLGANALIAVNSGAGGHAGPISSSILIPMLQNATSLPIISAGGVGTGTGLLSTLALGAQGVSIGSPFISVNESEVSKPYKKACLDYGAENIALSTKISGTPCTIIKTPYVEKIGLEQNPLESLLNKNKKLKKYVKMLTFYKGMKSLEQAAFGATYKTVWCAGPSIEFIKKEESTSDFIERIIEEYKVAKRNLDLIDL